MKLAATLFLFLAAAAAAPPKESVQETNDRLAQQVLKSIAGHENEPAEKVVMDIRIPQFKNVPAAQFINIMNQGYARALGVTCTPCHDDKDFSSDDKRPKRSARDLAGMPPATHQPLHGHNDIHDR